MRFSGKHLAAMAVGATWSVAPSHVTAEPITFTNFVNQDGVNTSGDFIDFKVTIDDDTAGKFRVVVEQALLPNTGDISGVFFDLTDGLSASDVSEVVGDIQSVGFNTNDLGNGVTVHPIPAFDVGVKYDQKDNLQTVTFLVNRGSLELSDFTRFGIRAQAVVPLGPGDEGSVKEFSVTSTTVQAVPLPGAVWGGLALLGYVGIRRRFQTDLSH